MSQLLEIYGLHAALISLLQRACRVTEQVLPPQPRGRRGFDFEFIMSERLKVTTDDPVFLR